MSTKPRCSLNDPTPPDCKHFLMLVSRYLFWGVHDVSGPRIAPMDRSELQQAIGKSQFA
jgi:hypothetical protein